MKKDKFILCVLASIVVICILVGWSKVGIDALYFPEVLFPLTKWTIPYLTVVFPVLLMVMYWNFILAKIKVTGWRTLVGLFVILPVSIIGSTLFYISYTSIIQTLFLCVMLIFLLFLYNYIVRKKTKSVTRGVKVKIIWYALVNTIVIIFLMSLCLGGLKVMYSPELPFTVWINQNFMILILGLLIVVCWDSCINKMHLSWLSVMPFFIIVISYEVTNSSSITTILFLVYSIIYRMKTFAISDSNTLNAN